MKHFDKLTEFRQAVYDHCLTVLWCGCEYRWPVEPRIRFRKQCLCRTLPRSQTLDHCDRWAMLVTLAPRELFLGRELVQDERLPW
jgi:hypothetical protein